MLTEPCHYRIIARHTRGLPPPDNSHSADWLRPRLAMNSGSVRFVGLFESAPWR